MKSAILTFLLALISLPFAAISAPDDGFVRGTPEIQSMNALTFGPDGVLLIGDSKTAKVFAVQTSTGTKGEFKAMHLKNIDQAISEVLGISMDEFSIQDMAVHPVTGEIYLAVESAGQPVLLTVSDGKNINIFDLNEVQFAEKSIAHAVAEDSKDRRGRSLRSWAISDMQFHDGQVLVTGLSDKEFGSTFRSMSFPFNDDQEDASLEIFHAAHGAYETHSPVKTFTTAEIDGIPYVVASYTCTPLVLFPLSDLKQGQHIKGRTVAELGAGNSPLDMVVLEKEGKRILLMANSNRPVMKINLEDISSYQGSLTDPVNTPGATAGVPYINFPMTNVLQLDRWGDSNWIMIKRQSNGDLDLISGNDFWL